MQSSPLPTRGAGTALSSPSPDTGARKSGVIYIAPHRLARTMRNDDMLAAIEEKLREGSPKSRGRHVTIPFLSRLGRWSQAYADWRLMVLLAAACAMPFVASLLSGAAQ